MRDATYSLVAQSLGLTTGDIAEIGGFSMRYAQYLMKGEKRFAIEFVNHLNELKYIYKDIEEVLYNESLEDQYVEKVMLFAYYSNEDLRSQQPNLPTVGFADGGFSGCYNMAVLGVFDRLLNNGVDAQILFFPESKET